MKKAFGKKLPAVRCGHNNEDGNCWGPVRMEEADSINQDNFINANYSCKGHFKLHTGGSYKIESKRD
jgi:hypothetical protein